MVDLGERAAFLEEALHPVAERREVLGRARAHDVALGAQHQRRRQVFLDRDRRAGLVERAVDDRKAAAADLPVDPVVQQLVAAGEGLVGDGHRRDLVERRDPSMRLPQFACQTTRSALAPGADNAYILRMTRRQSKAGKRCSNTGQKPPHDPQHDRLRGGCRRAARRLARRRAALGQPPLPRPHVELPDELRALETALRERIAAELKRGKVECRVALNRTAAGAAGAGGRPRSASRSSPRRPPTCSAHVPGATPLSTAEILRWPGVLAEPTVAARGARRRARTRSSTQALADLAAARAREGAKTRRDARRALRRHRGAGRAGRAAHSRDPRRLHREARRAAARSRARPRTRTG